ncbi:hypothetical protein Tsubulata_029977 [Turnera subulata]|uniref:RING-type E3 ubiquitin transferase n=1 Tax=Turnera subulata TaxID=218843 RepID=A0A9Q0JBS0_9ROSI|nr:hypothetical protein Tsubulata_029977 [Turnera subulata]
MASPSDQQPSSFFHWEFAENFKTTEFHLNGRVVFLLLIFFAFIVVITSLFLYVHCLCRDGRLAVQSSSSSGADTIAPPQATSLGLDPAIIDSLPIILVTKNVENGDVIIETECSICLSLFEDQEKVKVLPECNHAYHSECLDKWLSTQSSCPLCRASLRDVVDSKNASAPPQ